MPAILIADDHSIVRLGTIFLIKALYADAVIHEAETFDEVIKELDKQSFDLLILEIHMPGGNNLHMVEAVKMRQPDIGILIFSSYDEQQYAHRFLQAGANGFLQKKSSPEHIKTAIQKVLTKQTYRSHVVHDQLLDKLLNDGNTKPATEQLSNREMEVMQLLLKGAGTPVIKETLNIHDSAISFYKAKIFEKMKVSNIIELAEKVKLLSK